LLVADKVNTIIDMNTDNYMIKSHYPTRSNTETANI